MYRNVYYDIYKKCVKLWTWDENGNRMSIEVPYKPYIYIETESNADAMSIFNTKLAKRSFHNEKERREYVKNGALKRLFYNIPVEQQFLIDHFKFKNKDKDFNQFPLKTYFLDIETYSPGVFPSPDKAEHPINVITIYNTLDRMFHTWGTKGAGGGSYYGPDNVKYTQCLNETDMLKAFLRYWRSDFPDLVSGWNSQGFDIPYLINRINNVLGEDKAEDLSPVGSLYCRENVLTKMGRVENHWHIKGISHVDYMEAYKVFTKDNRERYNLGYIGNFELDEGKHPIPASELPMVADTDWQRFVDYNIQDVNILVKLEEKLHYLQIIRMLAYMGYTNFERATGTVGIVTGAMALRALDDGMIIPTFEHVEQKEYDGGYVRIPQKGISEATVSFDANSLYPNTIISCNISPETKVGKIIEKHKDKLTVRLLNKKEYEMSNDDFKKFIQKDNIAITSADVLYSQKKKGFCPKLIDDLYAERVNTQKELKKHKIDIRKCNEGSEKYLEHKKIIVEMDVMQYTLKILMNRIYGVFGNKHSPFYDIDAASSVTLTGQACSKQAAEIVQKWMKDTYGVNEDCVIYGDTDSIYITIAPALKAQNKPFVNSDGTVSKDAHEVVDNLGAILNTEINLWAKDTFNSTDPRFVFKREKICNSSVFLAKKNYILHVLDSEGIPKDEIKYTGVPVVKIAIPTKVKPLLKNVFATMMRTRDIDKTTDAISKLYEEYSKMDIEDIASPGNIKGYEKYADKTNGMQFIKGTPIHVKAAIAYNRLLEELGIDGKYEKIKSGVNMKKFYTQPNKYDLKVVGFIDRYPKEFDIDIDRKKMFDKSIFTSIRMMFDAVNWRVTNPSSAVATDLFKLLS